MLNGKAWPKAVRGPRMVVLRLLQPLLTSTTAQTLQQDLEKARIPHTGRLCVVCLIIPVVIIHLFIRAEREGDWLLHLYAFKRMIPYFFAAAHWNYAIYILWHIVDVTNLLPEGLLSAFLNRDHVCRYNSGLKNAVFLDQFGEQRYIRYGKGKGFERHFHKKK